MSKGFTFDFSEFQEFADNFERQFKEERFVFDVMNQLGNLMIRSVKEKTPVGQYDNTVFFVKNGKLLVFESKQKKGRKGGNLRRNWILDGVEKVGDSFIVSMSNNTEYASYVENGHRKADGTGWVEGQFFMKLTMDEIEGQLPAIVGPKFEAYLRKFGLGG